MIDAVRKAKLGWHCRRGMLELDLILNRFTQSQIDSLTETQLKAFEALLTCTDPELFSWLMGHSSPADRELVEIVEFIKLQDLSR
jgi:antitoxin CptB